MFLKVELEIRDAFFKDFKNLPPISALVFLQFPKPVYLYSFRGDLRLLLDF